MQLSRVSNCAPCQLQIDTRRRNSATQHPEKGISIPMVQKSTPRTTLLAAILTDK